MENQPITFTKEALSQALLLSSSVAEYKDAPLRIYIEGKGCDGFTYGVAFDEKQPDDTCFTIDTIDVVLDTESFKFLKNSIIDWVDDERGKGFLVENPNQKKFRGKFYKRKNWEERLLDD